MLWNQAVHTDREVAANRPDKLIKNKKEKTCTPIDVAIPADRNVVQKEAEKNLKYKSLCIEIQRMWNLKCTIVPVIIGATGIVTRSLKKNLETIPGKHSIDSLQKTAILGTSHIIWKVLQCEAWNLSGGDHRWFKRSTRKKCLWQETYISYNNNKLKYKDLNRKSGQMECESKNDTDYNWGDWNHVKITQTYLNNMPGKHEIRNSTKQPYWALHTYYWKCCCKSKKHISLVK